MTSISTSATATPVEEVGRFRSALVAIASDVSVALSECPDADQPNGWRKVATDRIDIARAALSATAPQQGEAGEDAALLADANSYYSAGQLEEIERQRDHLRSEIRRCDVAIEGGSSDPWWKEDRDRFRHSLKMLDRPALAQSPAPDATVREKVAREAWHPIIRKWDVADALARIKNGIGHGSLASDVLAAELEAIATDVADAILAALAQPHTIDVGEDWVLVPREPTKAMLEEAEFRPGNTIPCGVDGTTFDFRKVWSAMLDTIPASPRSDVEQG